MLLLLTTVVIASEMNCPDNGYVAWSTMQYIRDIDVNRVCYDLGDEITGNEYRDEFIIWDSVYQVYEFDFDGKNKLNWILNVNTSYVDSYVSYMIEIKRGPEWEQLEVRQLNYNGAYYNIKKLTPSNISILL